MGDILEEASSLVECKECPWYKACVTPMRFNAGDLKREMETAMPGVDQASMHGLRQMMANLAAAAENMVLEGCPVFIKRLKSSPRLAERLKKVMQVWETEE